MDSKEPQVKIQTQKENEVEIPVNPYYTPEEEAKHREEVRKRFSGKRILTNAAILMIMPAVIGAAELVFNAYGTSVPKYMEKKYHREFVQIDTRKDHGEYFVDVIPKGDPNTKIEVWIIEALPWYQEYSDDYFDVEATRYVENWLNDSVSSEYANRIITYCNTESTHVIRKSELKHPLNIDNVKYGPTQVPEAFSEVFLSVTFIGEKENEDKMIQEMYSIHRAIWTEFPFEKTQVMMRILDSKLFKDVSNTQGDIIYKAEDTYKKIPNDEKANYLFWVISSRYYEDIERAKIDYEYFRNGDSKSAELQ